MKMNRYNKLILQMDKLNCIECEKPLTDITMCGKVFPKNTVFVKSVTIPLENTPLKYYNFVCESCKTVNKCLAIVDESHPEFFNEI